MATTVVQAKHDAARVLIVEDDGIIARDIKMMLEELGYAVSGIASTGAEALALAANGNVDLALMDVNIKGNIDGIQTAAQLLKQQRLAIVYLTAHTDDNTLQRARETEPFGYIAKPITIADVKVGVAVALTRYRAQHQIEEREKWFLSILRSTGEAMIITNQQGRISFLNFAAEELAGITSGVVLGQALDDALRLVDKDGVRQQLFAADGAGQFSAPEAITGTIIRPDETRRQVLVSAEPLDKARQNGMVVVLHDISDLLRRELALENENEKLTHSNEKLKFLSYSLSHDLREPLRTINIYSDLLAMHEKEALSEDAKQQLRGIGDASRRMSSVMSSLLEYFSISNLDRSEARQIDAADSFREALSNLKSAIDESQAQIEAPNLPMVYAHPTALMLIFQNLVVNAIKYSGQKTPFIRVSACREGEFWLFTIEDNGMGFDPTQAQRIFELFRRGHDREHNGNGIGLATCQRLVQQNSGRIWAESTPGEGSQFHFTLPAEERGA